MKARWELVSSRRRVAPAASARVVRHARGDRRWARGCLPGRRCCTATSTPARRRIEATRAVVVVLPAVPVMPMLGLPSARAGGRRGTRRALLEHGASRPGVRPRASRRRGRRSRPRRGRSSRSTPGWTSIPSSRSSPAVRGSVSGLASRTALPSLASSRASATASRPKPSIRTSTPRSSRVDVVLSHVGTEDASSIGGCAVRGSSARLEHRLEPVDQLRLRLEQLHPRLGEPEPGGAIDLRELLQLPRPRRPLERERVARRRSASKSPSAHQAATIFPAFCRIVPRSTSASRATGGGAPSSSSNSRKRDVERLLARLDLALRDRPGTVVLPRPERPAGMDEQHLERVASAAVEEKACALLRHRGQPTYASATPRMISTTAANRNGTAGASVVARADSPGRRELFATPTSLPGRSRHRDRGRDRANYLPLRARA